MAHRRLVFYYDATEPLVLALLLLLRDVHVIICCRFPRSTARRGRFCSSARAHLPGQRLALFDLLQQLGVERASIRSCGQLSPG